MRGIRIPWGATKKLVPGRNAHKGGGEGKPVTLGGERAVIGNKEGQKVEKSTCNEMRGKDRTKES